MKRSSKRKSHMKRAYVVACAWDEEAGVWYVSETDVPGLATESTTVEGMTRKLRTLIPTLLSLNKGGTAAKVPVELLWRKQELISVKQR